MRRALLLLLLPAFAAGEDRWTDPHPGVRHLSRSDRYPYDDNPAYRAEAVVVDLGHPQVRLFATPPDQPGGVVSDFANRNGLDVAWNTNFFGSPQDACGLMMGDGRIWERAYDDGCHASIGFGDDNRAAIFVQGDPHGPPPEDWIRQVATGKPQPILVAGEPTFHYGCGGNCAYNPRTGIGLSQDRRTLYVVVIDGRQAGTVGAGLDDLANVMRDLGAWDAVNLDGGGSSALFVRGDGGIVNNPSDGRERTVCCHMGVRIVDPPPPPEPDAAVPPPDAQPASPDAAEAPDMTWPDARVGLDAGSAAPDARTLADARPAPDRNRFEGGLGEPLPEPAPEPSAGATQTGGCQFVPTAPFLLTPPLRRRRRARCPRR